MLDCRRMTHRVHTILSLLAEDHAPAALRPSILLAVDWPTVAEEAPATGDDSGIACAASGILSGIGGRENLPALTLATLPLLAARLATVAASLTTTGDKAMAAHADALWGAAAALVGMPTEVREVPLAARVTHWRAMVQARDTALGALGWDGAENLQAWTAHQKATLENIREALGACTGETAMGAAVRVAEGYRSFKSAHAEMCVKFRDEGALVNTQIINERDRALADIHALRDILKVPEGGNLVDHASAFAERHMRRVDESTIEAARMNEENTALKTERDKNLRASLTVMETEVARLTARSPVGRITGIKVTVNGVAATGFVEGDTIVISDLGQRVTTKPRPQPGDVVPWAEVEDGALYHRPGERCPFRMSVGGRVGAMYDADDRDILRMVEGTFGAGDPEFENHTPEHPLILVARNLGSDPDAWRAAMRAWTSKGGK